LTLKLLPVELALYFFERRSEQSMRGFLKPAMKMKPMPTFGGVALTLATTKKTTTKTV